MDFHGVVLILCCGTLHCVPQSVSGYFESIFALLRDVSLLFFNLLRPCSDHFFFKPFAENNWKIKSIKMQLQSALQSDDNKIPSLEDCASLTQLLCSPELNGTL